MSYMLNKKQFNRGEELNRVYSSDKNSHLNYFTRRNQSRIAKGQKPKSGYNWVKRAQEVGLVR